MDNKIISCDWGTSAFRLKLIDRHTQKCLGVVKTQHGVAKTYRIWKTESTKKRELFFQEYLKKQILLLSEQIGENLTNIPVVLSGMASSSIGMLELPYAGIPLDLLGEGLIWKQFPANELFPHPIYLISGIKTENDVMRGEEVEIIGLADHIESSSFVSIFPGTHSKHIWIENKYIIDFQTYMTGEIFHLITQHSILSASIEHEESTFDFEAFEAGVQNSKHLHILQGLFSVRANELLYQTSKKYNFHYLSGLLISSELLSLQGIDLPVYLCGGNHLSLLYEEALRMLNINVHIILPEFVEQAVSIGHNKLIPK